MARANTAKRVDDRALLTLIGDVFGLLELEELRHGLLEALHRALPSDYISLNEIGPGLETLDTIIRPDVAGEMLDAWERFAHENPLLRRYLRTLDGRAYRFSDVIEAERLHELALYRELYAPLGLEHQLAFTLPAHSDRVLAIALSRGGDDYSDAERDFANRARPFLIQAYLNAIAHETLGARGSERDQHAAPSVDALRAAGMTRRESEVLALLALGRSNHHIASALGISHRTVGKHLEHSFRKLGVADRSTAAGRIWELPRVSLRGAGT